MSSVPIQTAPVSEGPRLEGSEATNAERPYGSILFDSCDGKPTACEGPEFESFRDLNIDTVLKAVADGREGYDLMSFFTRPLSSLELISYRHEVFCDLEVEATLKAIKRFSTGMKVVRDNLTASRERSYPREQERWFLDAANRYVSSVAQLATDLQTAPMGSRGLAAFGRFLSTYIESPQFEHLRSDVCDLERDLASIRYEVLLREDTVTVLPCNREKVTDYSKTIGDLFARFQQGTSKSYLVKFPPTEAMNHIEAQVLEGVVQKTPSVFRALSGFLAEHRNFRNDTVERFEREIQFYLAWIDHIAAIRSAELAFCLPVLSADDKDERCHGSFDLALAWKRVADRQPVVCNDFSLRGCERILVVTGPNQGGKTTFARMYGQLHYFARLGVPVPGTEARLFLCDRVLAHFEREENVGELRGKLEDDLMRMHRILGTVTPRSVVVINEVFSSTTAKDAAELSRRVLERISELDLHCVCVTFLDELSTLDDKTVSMVAEVSADDPTVRTFRVARRPANGLAHAVALAERHLLTYGQLKRRLNR